MGDIVKMEFKPKQELVFSCIKCDAQVFWLDYEGTICCKACSAKQLPPEEWVERLNANMEKQASEDE